MPFWVYLWAGPLELAAVFAMLCAELGVVPAVSGIAVMLSIIPVQVRGVAGFD